MLQLSEAFTATPMAQHLRSFIPGFRSRLNAIEVSRTANHVVLNANFIGRAYQTRLYIRFPFQSLLLVLDPQCSRVHTKSVGRTWSRALREKSRSFDTKHIFRYCPFYRCEDADITELKTVVRLTLYSKCGYNQISWTKIDERTAYFSRLNLIAVVWNRKLRRFVSPWKSFESKHR